MPGGADEVGDAGAREGVGVFGRRVAVDCAAGAPDVFVGCAPGGAALGAGGLADDEGAVGDASAICAGAISSATIAGSLPVPAALYARTLSVCEPPVAFHFCTTEKEA